MRHFTSLSFLAAICLLSCTASQKISRLTATTLLNDSALLNAHIGISLYDAETGKYLYNYQGNKYFVPASNTKLFTCYAGMKYLGDSLTGITYSQYDSAITLQPTGDPTFLHPDFKKQPVLDFLKNEKRKLYFPMPQWQENALGYGWAWDDYNDNYMVERSPFPVTGNIALYKLNNLVMAGNKAAYVQWNTSPAYFKGLVDSLMVLPPDMAASPKFVDTAVLRKQFYTFSLLRNRTGNDVRMIVGNRKFAATEIPFYTDTINTALQILRNDYGLAINKGNMPKIYDNGHDMPRARTFYRVKSQPTDTMLRPMMHRSDNFFAEQTLLMVSNEKLGYMNMGDIIDTLLKSDLSDLPQRPKWVDGSGLSRYNLFTPQSMVQIVVKMKNEFGLKRLTGILATGGQGTLGNYYQNLAGKIFAKTGTLSNNCALSGFLVTKKGKLLIFSILANNYQTGATPVRRAVEKWLNEVYSSN
jgi:serine-type D-Ala-D-Ala carboxypeptidase/endopeptidase (penicillin-binding protein 4)